MYFEIENTPEQIKRARRTENVIKNSPKEECPRLVLAPFSKPPQVVFENVLIGTSCERNLEVFNPSQKLQQITLSRTLPAGLIINLPGEWLVLEPKTCYYLTMIWSPLQPTALRETLRFTDENRGRYDVIIVLKSVMDVKGKRNQHKFKTSPGKIKKVSKKSPVAVFKKKPETTFNATKIKNTVIQTTVTQNYLRTTYNKENLSMRNNCSEKSRPEKCPFDSSSNVDFNFDTSKIFCNYKRSISEKFSQQNCAKSYNMINNRSNTQALNILKPSNKQLDISDADIFDNLKFTPLKSMNTNSEKLDKDPKIIFSMNSESDFDDSLDKKIQNVENETHSIICVTYTEPPNKWLTVNHQAQYVTHTETPNVQNKKIPNTSSPKELNSPNFTINTEISRISDLSFNPQRFSTERKIFPKLNNETHDVLDTVNMKLNSDTYTKNSPYILIEPQSNQICMEKPSHFFTKEQPKMCRQALFSEYELQKESHEKNIHTQTFENNVWQNNLRLDVKSPPRSITPPLQSIPEESVQFSHTQVLDKSDQQTTFTINRTFDKLDRTPFSMTNRQSWSKKAVRAESDLWKVPIAHVKKSLKCKTNIKTKESVSEKLIKTPFKGNKSVTQNISLNQVGNVYSQSLTVDPFLSSSYFYDEEAIDKFEKEFKRWLNYILTPPTDLDSNAEQQMDVGKAWIENRNKEVPLAPTREQVSSSYHNSHRLESLRRAARALLINPEFTQVFQKLSGQIDKKLITIRTDKNLHLDVGLQKTIMELLLSYNPLWLRIGLEAVYNLVLPLKSNNDVEGLSTFIIQRMFKNPHLKNKHSKSNAPNMLLPAYMEAIKKFTLKKFFMLVFFLDQAKQKKLISHDPCLFCRNAVCKESREIIIRFTRELIAGIGDITKHLRPLGYIVSHKQSYIDEFKYAVHNIAIDLRDGVRLTKVMEVILIKNGLLNQLRTPAISRLQKIHNVQVALNALKESGFIISGDINPTDIADGHREKTLSLLWQLIHVFRAPLFEKAANIIQIWWRKKYGNILEKRKEEERTREKRNDAASMIQRWWRTIQYNRLMEFQMRQVIRATIIIQKYCRKWLHQTHFNKIKRSVIKIEVWYKSIKLIRDAKKTFMNLKLAREELRLTSAITIQKYVRRFLYMKKYRRTLSKIIRIQSLIRRFLARKRYLKLIKYVTFAQQKYRGKLLMKTEVRNLAKVKRSAVIIQSYFRMIKEYRLFKKLKITARIIEEHYIALIAMRKERNRYLKLKHSVIVIQSLYRAKKARQEYKRKLNLIIKLQRYIRAHQLMKKDKTVFLQTKKAAIILQNRIRSYLITKRERQYFITVRQSTILIQRYFRSYKITKYHRNNYIVLRNAAIKIQNFYRALLLMRQQKSSYLKLKYAALIFQRRYRALVLMKITKGYYKKLLTATLLIQRRYRAQMQMRKERTNYIKMKCSSLKIQDAYRSYLLRKKQREEFLNKKRAAILIQNRFRNYKKGKQIQEEFQLVKHACVVIQSIYRAYIIGSKQKREYYKIKTATICIQNYYRSYIEMKTIRNQFIQLKTATVTIQRFYRLHLESKKQRSAYLKTKNAATVIQIHYRRYRVSKMVRRNYIELRNAVIYIQSWYRSVHAMRKDMKNYLQLKQNAVVIQQKYRALLSMRNERARYLQLKSAVLTIQSRLRAHSLMKKQKCEYTKILKACTYIQQRYRAYLVGKIQREQYLKLNHYVAIIQQRYRAVVAMKKDRNSYLAMRSAAVFIQSKFRANKLMYEKRFKYKRVLKACVTIQRAYRAHIIGNKQRTEYVTTKSAIIFIQRRFRSIKETRNIRHQYLLLRNAVVFTQRCFRATMTARKIKQNEAAKIIQYWFKLLQRRNECRNNYIKLRNNIIIIQSISRMYILRKRFITMKHAVLKIQSYYRAYKQGLAEKQKYMHVRNLITKLQACVRCSIERNRYLKIRSAVVTIQRAYRLQKQQTLMKKRREAAAICIQKNVRRYLIQLNYKYFMQKVVCIQRLWKGKLVMRLMRCDFLQKRKFIIKLQAIVRGNLVRKQIQLQKEKLQETRQQQKRHWAATKIQALFKGHLARKELAYDERVVTLRRRWREGALKSTQKSLKDLNEEVMDGLRNMSDIETVIRIFRELEKLTEVFPMKYKENASSIVRRVYIYMSVTNRSISSIEVLKSAASVLVNLTRYEITGPKIYARDRISPILKFMWRFSNSETHLFCILSTYLWLFSKYDDVKSDLTDFLHISENHKILVTIKNNVERNKRMTINARNKSHMSHSSKYSHTLNQSMRDMNYSISSTNNFVLPALEPDYGIVRADKPRYFEDPHQAIECLFHTYTL